MQPICVCGTSHGVTIARVTCAVPLSARVRLGTRNNRDGHLYKTNYLLSTMIKTFNFVSSRR